MTNRQYEPIIGLEIHAQLLTRSKMFCGCSAAYSDAPPNTIVCAVCAGMPGALPTINRAAVDYAVAVAVALNCSVAAHSKFDRKNYSYPDLPKGYQISQYDLPLGTAGWIDFDVDGRNCHCGITRVHLEEDTGKSLHVQIDGRDVSLVDYNRSGVPLLEIVSEPDMRSPEEARQYFSTLRQILMYLGVNDGNLQEGSMRADVNVSLRPWGGALPPNKVEIKNLNSFRAVQRALEHEIERQSRVLDRGDVVVQETRGWQEDRDVTVPQRSKEYAHDYRYFPEPDLPPLALALPRVEQIRSALPELPLARVARFVEAYGLQEAIALVLTDERPLADFFEATLRAESALPPHAVANWMSGEVLRLLNESKLSLAQSSLEPESFAHLIALVENEIISHTAGKTVLEQMFATREEPEVIVDRLNLRQVSDEAQLEDLVESIIGGNPILVETYRNGKPNVLNALVGQVMKASNGKAKPEAVRMIVERRLADPV